MVNAGQYSTWCAHLSTWLAAGRRLRCHPGTEQPEEKWEIFPWQFTRGVSRQERYNMVTSPS